MALTPPPAAPVRSMSQAAFDNAMAAYLAWLATNVTEQSALVAAMNALAAGTACAIPYTFSTATADADPGAGALRLDNATQSGATTIRADLAGADGATWTSVLDTFDDSTSAVKGQLALVGLNDPSKWLLFNVTALAAPPGYRNITVSNIGASSVSPFVSGDQVVLKFTRTGDKGSTGAGSLLRVSVFTSSGTWTKGANTSTIKVRGVAGGAGGGASQNSAFSAGGGGGAGGYFEKLIDVTAVSSAAVTIGSGGVGASTNAGSGTTGGTSSFGAYATATGGSPGTGGLSGAAGDGGTATGGDLNVKGGAGTPGVAIVNTPIGGAGGASALGGPGPSFSDTNSDGSAGNAYGSGGGGGVSDSSSGTFKSGGAGKAGVIIVEEYA